MDSQKPTLKVILSLIAIDELDAIWRWNAARYNAQLASQYILFLKSRIDQLGKDYSKGKFVGTRADLRYVNIRRKARGHGHAAVYRVDQTKVDILHVFHTAQDWQAKLVE